MANPDLGDQLFGVPDLLRWRLISAPKYFVLPRHSVPQTARYPNDLAAPEVDYQ